MRPLTLPPVDAAARLNASPWARLLTDPERIQQAALRWAKALECPVEINALGIAAAPPPPGPTAGLCFPDGQAGMLAIDGQLIAGRMTALTGGAVRTIGPVPLSPAEEGLFAWLVLAWCAELPTPPALDWVDGGAGLWRPAWRGPSVRWRVVLGDTVGWARWQLPPQAGTAVGDLRADLPLPLELSAGRTHLKRRPRPGDHVLLHTSPSLRLQTRRWPVERAGSRWHITTTAESRMVQPLDDLPLVVDARVGRLSLTVAEVSALEPGSVLPLAPDTAPIITLTIDNRPIARGVLVDDDGRAAVQITQLIEDG